MNLKLDESIAIGYKSLAQKIRVMSEFWTQENLFCPCCGNSHVDKLPNNSPVADMQCENCGEIFELKSKKNRIGKKIVDGAYSTMIERITGNINPQLLLIQYSPRLFITDLILVPKFFFTPGIIEKRKPLSANARRAGWVGCNIIYEKIPSQGKIDIVRDGVEISTADVLKNYAHTKKLQTENIILRGWMLDILHCINKLDTEIFTLKDIYSYTDYLKLRHGDNHNVEAKIRQQLQFLRDKGFVEFVGRGKYRKVI